MDIQLGSLSGLEITREEFLFLMHTLHVDSFIGSPKQEISKELESFLQKGDKEKVENSLLAKKVITRKRPQGLEIIPGIKEILDTVFFPEKAIFILRNKINTGRQVFYVMQKDKSIVLHSVTKEREHFIHLFPQSRNLYQFLVNWFPLSRLPVSATQFEIDEDSFTKIRSLDASGKLGDFTSLLQSITMDSDEKKSFIRAFSERRMTGVLSRISFKEKNPVLECTLTIVSDGRTGWLISENKLPVMDKKQLRIRRFGTDFLVIVGEFVEWFTGEKLPKQQADPSGKFIRYTLNLDEFTMALAAVNCVELSKKLYAAISRDIKREQYADRMDKAQKSLVEHCLCTMTDRGLPVLNEDLAQAVFSVAKSDSMIQIKASGMGPAADTGIYLVHGRFFSAYYNYGEQLQILEYGKYNEAGLYLESLFPVLPKAKHKEKTTFDISIHTLDQLYLLRSNTQEIEKILCSDGISDLIARLLAEDFSDATFRATLLRKDPPEENENMGGKKNRKTTSMLLLMKSPRRSWMFQFQDSNPKGKATIPDQVDIAKALRELIA